MHRSGSGLIKNGFLEPRSNRSISGQHSLVGYRPANHLAEIMKDVEGDRSLLKRLAARRLVSVLQGKVTRLYYRVILRLTRERDELNISGTTKQLTMSRRSSNVTLQFLSLNKTFSSFSSARPIRNVRQFAALIGKKLFLAKLEPFQKLKRHLQSTRLKRSNMGRAAQQIQDFIRKRLKRLKKEAYFTLVSYSYSQVRSSKADLERQMCSTARKSGQHLIRVLKKVYRDKLREVTKRLKDRSNRIGILLRLDKIVCRVVSRSVLTGKRAAFRALQGNTRLANSFNKIVSFSNVLLVKLVKNSLKAGWAGLRQAVQKKSRRCRNIDSSGTILRGIVNKRLRIGFSRIVMNNVQAQLLVRAIRTAKGELEEAEQAKRKAQLERFEDALQQTERQLKKQEVQNRQLLTKLISLEKQLAEYHREQRAQKLEMSRLDRQLKEKDSTIKRLLIEQNRTNEFLAKQKEDIFQLRMNRPFSCECIEGKNKEFSELTDAGRALNSLIEKHVQETAESTEQESGAVEFMQHQYHLFRGVLQQSQKVVAAFSLNPLFKNDFPVLSYLRGSFRQIFEFLTESYSTFFSQQTLSRYIGRVRALPQDSRFDVVYLSRLTTELLEHIRPETETSGYQLVRSKIIEFSRASEAFNRQYRRLLEKNGPLKLLLSKLEHTEKDMRNYMKEFSDMPIKATASNSNSHSAEPADSRVLKLIRPLLIDYLCESTSYNKRRHIREKLLILLELSPEELQSLKNNS